MPLIAQHLNVSRYTVQCQWIKADQKGYLPEHLGIDEFKSVRQATSGMSCILMNAQDSVLDRTQDALRDYFIRSSDAGQDCHHGYVSTLLPVFLAQFSNAKIVINRFHIVQLLNNTLKMHQIKIMNEIHYKDHVITSN